MKKCMPAVFILFALLLLSFSGCDKNNQREDTKAADPLGEAQTAARTANPGGLEYNDGEKGLYIMLPNENWRLSSDEEGCIGFSEDAGMINIYYGDDDGSAYKNVPKNKEDVLKILEKAGISADWVDVQRFSLNEDDDKNVRTYSYTIKFDVPDDEGSKNEFYTVSKSICGKDRVCVAAGQIYRKDAVESCERSVESFAVY